MIWYALGAITTTAIVAARDYLYTRRHPEVLLAGVPEYWLYIVVAALWPLYVIVGLVGEVQRWRARR